MERRRVISVSLGAEHTPSTSAPEQTQESSPVQPLLVNTEQTYRGTLHSFQRTVPFKQDKLKHYSISSMTGHRHHGL